MKRRERHYRVAKQVEDPKVWGEDPGVIFFPEDEPLGEPVPEYYEHDSELQEWWENGQETLEDLRNKIEGLLRKERADRIEMNRKAIASITEKKGRPLGSSEYFAAMRCANAGYEACDKKIKSSPAAKHNPVPGSEDRKLYDDLGWVAYMIGWKHRAWQRREMMTAWD